MGSNYKPQEVKFIIDSAREGLAPQVIQKEVLKKFEINRPIGAIKSFIKKGGGEVVFQMRRHKSGISIIRLKCCNCRKPFSIDTSNPDMYTPEVRKTWKCVFCA